MNFTAIISGIGSLKEAMECGKEVADPASWKNKSLTSNKIATVLAFALIVARIAGVDLPIGQETLEIGAVGLAGVLFLINNIVTLATSKKVGTHQ
jgi:hypothetical protein